MSAPTRIATVQPPVPQGDGGYAHSVSRGLELVQEAAQAGGQIICLPELFAVYGLPPGEWRQRVESGDPALDECAGLAQRYGVTILCPSLERWGGHLFNTTWIVGADGQIAGRYRKVHLTLSEREDRDLTAGEEFPIFAAAGLRFGIMTCYDVYFPETARILAVRGAQAIFWPSLQRGATEEVLRLQAGSRAFDNCVYVVRSSYGHPAQVAWRPGMMAGMSCIVNWEGRVVADLGHDEGFLVADIPTGEPRPRYRSYDGAPDSPRRYLFEDRRPELYSPLCDRTGGRSHQG